jgi:ABC-type transport system involved in multi-copper enzyme maturation permease subunit/ABC-type uncharacterized transport system involved in gliding motility auxiliary subunit
MNEKRAGALVKKEWANYLDSPLGYVVVIVFLVLWEFLFFRNAFLVGEASLRGLFELLPWLLLLYIPALTMGSIAQERRDGTLEWLLTRPVRDSELVAGKFLSAWLLVGVTLVLTLPIAGAFNTFGELDWGVVVSQYGAALLLSAAFIALGIFVSSLFEHPIAALLVTAVAGFGWIIAGSEFVTASLPWALGRVLEQVSLLTHFQSLARGVWDVRDLWFFLTAIFIFLGGAYVSLLKRRDERIRGGRRTFIAVVILIVMCLTGVGVFWWPARWDATADQRYALHATTTETLRSLPDVVTVTLFASRALPAQLQPVVRDTRDILRDYQTDGRGKLVVQYRYPDENVESATEAETQGVQAVQLNTISQDQLQVQKGYLGLVISFREQKEVIPFVQSTEDLEYQLTRGIEKLIRTEKRALLFLTPEMTFSEGGSFGAWQEALAAHYAIRTASAPLVREEWQDVAGVVVARTFSPEEAEALRTYLRDGGSAIFLVDTMSINSQLLMASPQEHAAVAVLQDFGITVHANVAYDVRSHESVRLTDGQVGYVLPYPFWPRVMVREESREVVSDLESAVIPWGSTVTIDQERIEQQSGTSAALLATTQFGGYQEGTFSLRPDQPPATDALGEQMLAVRAELGKTRLVVAGDSDFLSDAYVEQAPSHLAFGLGAVSWITGDTTLAALKAKSVVEKRLLFQNTQQMAWVRYGSLAGAALVPAVVGVARWRRRRQRSGLTYSAAREPVS